MGRSNIVRYNRNLGRYVNKVIKSKQEKKIIDEIFDTNMDNEGTIYDLAQLRNIQKGDSMFERQGDFIDLVSVSIRGFIRFPTPSGSPILINTEYYARIIVFQWLDDAFLNNPGPEDIIQVYNQANPTGGIDVQAFYNKENAGKFKILKDKSFSVNFYSGGVLIPFKWTFVNMPVKTIPFSLTQGSPNFHPTTGDIFILVICNADTATTDTPEVWWASRTVFTDS